MELTPSAVDDPGPPAARSIFSDRRLELAAVPAAFVLAWPLVAAGIGMIPVLFYHEFGHAIAAWLCGRWAFAIPIAGLTFIGQERSWFVTLVLAALLGWLLKRSWEEDRHALLLFSAATLAAMGCLALASPRAQDAVVLYGGCAGELVLSTLVILAFSVDVSEKLRWDFWRYPLLLTATCMFFYSASFWHGLETGADGRTVTQVLVESQDNDADWRRLINDHGWTPQGLADSYSGLSKACAGAIALQYAFVALFRKR